MEPVSIIIPAYNRLELLSKTLLSVVSQTYTEWVAYICDDGSSEDIQAILEPFHEERFIYQRLEHGGIGSTRNRGLTMVQTPYVVMLDSDDIWKPGFLKTTLSFLEQHPECDMVQTAQGTIDYHSNYLTRRNSSLEASTHNGEFGNAYYAVQSALGYFLKEQYGQNNFSSLIIRSELAKNVAMEEIDFMEDWDYWVKLGQTGATIAYLDEELCLYRTYERQVVIPRQIASLESTIEMIRRHKFSESWQVSIQRSIIGNLYEMIGFDYLALNHRLKAAKALFASLKLHVTVRRLYGISRCVVPGLTKSLKMSFSKNS